MWLCAVEGGYVAMSSSAARKARIGEVPQAEGFGKNQRCRFTIFSTFYLAGKATSRELLCVVHLLHLQ